MTSKTPREGAQTKTIKFLWNCKINNKKQRVTILKNGNNIIKKCMAIKNNFTKINSKFGPYFLFV